jgi:hypothetical protein
MTPDSALPNRRDLAFLTPLFLFMVVVFRPAHSRHAGVERQQSRRYAQALRDVFQVPVYLKVLATPPGSPS